MKILILSASAMALALAAGPSLAAATHGSGAASAGPQQPIPYSQLNSYMKASPRQRASHDWWAGQASTGASANTSALGASGGDQTTGGSASGTAAQPDWSANRTGADVAPSITGMPPTTSGPSSPKGGASMATPGSAPGSTAVNPPASSSTSATPPPRT